VRDEAEVELEDVARGLAEAKGKAILCGDADGANRLLAAELAAKGALREVQMWSALEGGRPEEAWNLLVEAQNLAASAARIDEVAGYSHDVNYRLAVEAVAFPPQIYMSTGMIVQEAECSICGSQYDECEHVKGRAYSGAMCTRVITRGDLLEVSIVDEPSDKRCRVTTVDGIDTLTLLPNRHDGEDVENRSAG